jgi:aspartate/tyrosine/aromatic aminotransferase
VRSGARWARRHPERRYRALWLFHGFCHNPSGTNFSLVAWEAAAEIIARRGILPLVDLAYQGFGRGLDEDASGVRLFARRLPELLVAFSCTKNFGLYCERTGCALVLTDNARSAGLTAEHMALVAGPLYSMPPDHGSAIVRTILGDKWLAGCWRDELEATRVAIVSKRRQFSAAFLAVSGARGFDYLEQGTRLFARLKMSRTQIETVRLAHGIYISKTDGSTSRGFPRSERRLSSRQFSRS